ncbi:CPBP family intramembrane metalloprotease [Dysgonomonas sp. Marseille-P4677]|uniref:CPBP family intramembrane glutamic endopeptidase n=1 Tax=Dysgonomonas sp. Marseille-P4677 TaxID=2364790 RepID=UPI001913A6A2|nr:CPBP family intramembrane glutamic endopeptidase [Dysgonomonas sp. Marseille-P4677]MBK5720841.1 CPBP family intramembrane metalloprotease [Dysgonomonas sp. Marseille-P4677]
MSNNKSILYNMGGWSQFFFLCFLSFTGLMLASFIILMTMSMDQMMNSANSMRLAMAIQTIFLFVIPALLFTYLCQEKPKHYLKVDVDTNYLLLFIAIIFIIVAQPLINSISYYNQQLVLPDSMASIEQWMRASEDSAQKSLKLLFTDKTIFGLVFNLLVLAIVAGLGEELFFRGCIQQIIQKAFVNRHVAIWITAIIFSAVHFQFYGFVPRVLLGALLGYLFIWLGSIWVPVIVHTAHNAINVILMYIYYGTPEFDQMENLELGQNAPFIIISLILSVATLFMIYRNRIISKESEN